MSNRIDYAMLGWSLACIHWLVFIMLGCFHGKLTFSWAYPITGFVHIGIIAVSVWSIRRTNKTMHERKNHENGQKGGAGNGL